MTVRPLEWTASHGVRILDQTKLPHQEVYLELETAEEMAEAIRQLRVRGAPAIGIAAAVGLVVGLRPHRTKTRDAFQGELGRLAAVLDATRPTAVNLHWALERMARAAANASGDSAAIWERLRSEAQAIWDEDREMCHQIGEVGLALIPDGATVLTHCNTGALATGGIGTALAPIYLAHQHRSNVRVYVDETRPLGQGARLTAWELERVGVACTVVTDSVVGSLLKDAKVDAILVGADRIARNGDVANKVGTYSLAVLAKHHDVPFYVCAPTSTFDPHIASGDDVPIEQRSADEVPHPAGVQVFNPAFDVTPAKFVTAYVTNTGVLHPPFDAP